MKPRNFFQVLLVGVLYLLSGACCKGLVYEEVFDFYEKLLTVAEKIERNPSLQSEWDERFNRQADVEIPPAEFTCDVTQRSPTPPTNVHQLRPSDINVIAAFGDSITAGNGLGARNALEVALENRGESWAIGGDRSIEEGVLTLPNILKKFNPGLKGYSTCISPEFINFEYREWFNVARPGATSRTLYSEAQTLVSRMKNDKRVDYENDWKLLTMFVGGNDLCASCKSDYTREAWYVNHVTALEYLKANMPRTVVNLVSMFDVTPLQNLSKGILCEVLQWGFCDCARNTTTLPKLHDLVMEYNEVFFEIAAESRFHADDFTVIVQPHMRDLLPPIDAEGKYVKDILAPDCFHPTRISHQGFAVWLWNNLLVPVGHKPTWSDSNDFDVKIACPSEEHPFIFTHLNSVNVTWPSPTPAPPTTPASGK